MKLRIKESTNTKDPRQLWAEKMGVDPKLLRTSNTSKGTVITISALNMFEIYGKGLNNKDIEKAGNEVIKELGLDGECYITDLGNYSGAKLKYTNTKKESISRLQEGPTKAYPGDIGPSNMTLDRLFKALTPTARDMEFLKDNYGIDTFDVRWHSADKNAIDIFATMMSEDEQYRADETFYVFESKKYDDSYVLGTEELGIRIIDKISEVWDIVSVCLRKQLNGL